MSKEITSVSICCICYHHFNGPGRAIDPVCVCVSAYLRVGTITFELNNLYPRHFRMVHLGPISGTSSKIRVMSQSSRSQNENVPFRLRMHTGKDARYDMTYFRLSSCLRWSGRRDLARRPVRCKRRSSRDAVHCRLTKTLLRCLHDAVVEPCGDSAGRLLSTTVRLLRQPEMDRYDCHLGTSTIGHSPCRSATRSGR